ncbi:MAG: dipeptidase PepE [Cyclobacteriaceae bacterium]|nr:dipeptidase PepE [Cyclobacteriaceae bacterium]
MKGHPYLEWPQEYLKAFLKGIKKVAFVPYAGVTMSYNEYTDSVKKAFEEYEIAITGIHVVEDKVELIKRSDCVMVGGGNSFSLLNQLQKENLIEPIRKAVKSGIRYVGWSAGSNMACSTLKTTNDMPIEQPASFEAIGLIDYQINPHFTNETIPNHGGESRELRIKEYLVKNVESTVVGLPEGMLIEVHGNETELKGSGEAILFKAGQQPLKVKPGKVKFD